MTYEKNDRVTVTIEDIGSEGEGIGRVDGFTLFVKDAVVGDTVEAKIVKSKKNYAYARLEKVLKASPFRVEPPCPFHRQCGGCQIQALSYEKQLEFKDRKIRNNLIRIGGFDETFVDERMEPIMGMEKPWHYRNKAQYPVGTDREGNVVTGFYAGRTHTIVANTDCLLGVEENKEVLDIILDHMGRYHISAYDEVSGEGLVRHILIRKGFSSGEIMVCLVLNKETPTGLYSEASPGQNDYRHRLAVYEFIPEQGELLGRLEHIRGIASVSVSLNRSRSNVIMGKEIFTIWGEPVITDAIHMRDMTIEGYPMTGKELNFHISPLSFYQVNPVQTEKLYSIALEFAGLTGRETVWDLYCGIGTISLFLAGSAKRVYGVEIVPEAVEDARENAKRNGITNAEFFVGKAEEVLPEFYAKGSQITADDSRKADFGTDGEVLRGKDVPYSSEMLHPDVIVVDPPRKGCDEACLMTMLKMQPERIVYVSCDSATLARDLRVLCDGGYEVKRIRGVDMFPQSVHVETVVLLSKGDIQSKKIRVDFSLEDMDMSGFRKGATYQEIKDYVKEQTGLSVSSLYISQIKRKCGLEVGQNYNLAKKENAKVPQCPPEKEKAIREALKYFRMI